VDPANPQAQVSKRPFTLAGISGTLALMNGRLAKVVKQKKRHTQRGEAQKQKLVDAAYDIIAEEGFEGLRTREVAGRANLNVSTLHYYFATKEDLVRSVARRLLAEFKEGRESADSQADGPGGTPQDSRGTLESLRAAFTSQSRILQKRPAAYVVVMELFTRSLHDRKMGPVVQELLDTWEGHFRSLITEGVRTGQISPPSDVSTATRALQSLLIGRAMITLIKGEEPEPESMFQQVSRWFSPRAKNGPSTS
jgi:AcrR family transcriptional regulator